jgi:hypothetical protein
MVIPKDIRACLALDPVGPVLVSITVGRQRVLLEGADASGYAEAEDFLEELDLP